MSIKRYAAHTNIDDFQSDWHESKDGPMVKYEDYAESQRQFWQLSVTIENLERKAEQLAAENARMKAAGNKLFLSAISLMEDPELKIDHARDIKDWERNETPATDAILAEVRASGVEMFAASLKVVGGQEHPYSAVASDFAAKIRQEAK